jgi:hypothetical protein
MITSLLLNHLSRNINSKESFGGKVGGPPIIITIEV